MKKIIIALISLLAFGCCRSYHPKMNSDGLPENVATFDFDGCTYIIFTTSGSLDAGCSMVHHSKCKNH